MGAGGSKSVHVSDTIDTLRFVLAQVANLVASLRNGFPKLDRACCNNQNLFLLLDHVTFIVT